MFQRSSKFLIIGVGIAAVLIFAGAPRAQADTGCAQNTTLDFVADSPSGSFIPNANVTVYKQVTDANGQSKPGAQVASGSTDATVGTLHLSWRDTAAGTTYALRVRTISNDQASFWFYDNNWSCGQAVSLSKFLSGIVFTLHDETGNLLTNTSFNVYSQIYSNGQPAKQLQQSIAGLNSGSSGQTAAYLPQGSVRSIDKTPSDVYALDLSRNGQKFDFYNIAVSDGAISTVNYFIPAISVLLQDSTGALFPKGTNVAVFKQTVDANNLQQAGTQVGSFTLGNDGSGTLEAPVGVYALGIKDQNNNYQYFWNVSVNDGQSNSYNLTATSSSATAPITTACQNNSQLTLTFSTVAGQVITGLHFAIYEQGSDANGLPIAGNQVGGGTINSSGEGTVSFRPDPRDIYALKVWGQNSNLGVFWFYGALRFVCNTDRTLAETVPALNVILRDNTGALLRNYSFSLYAQEYDADNHPFFQSSDLIGNFQTDGGGETTAYVAPYNSYVPGQSGVYAISLKDADNNTENFYNIKMTADKDYSFSSSFSGLSGSLSDAQSQPLANKNLDLYEEKVNSGLYTLGKKLLSVKTDSGGQFQFEYPAGTYALVSSDDFNQSNVFWNITIGSGNNYQKLMTSLINFKLSDPQGQGVASNPSLQLYSLTGRNGVYYRGSQVGTVKLTADNTASASLAAGSYLAYYAGLGNQSFGQAFYAKNGSTYSVNISLNSKYLISATQYFRLSGAPTSAASSGSTSSGSSSSSSSLSSSGLAFSLKGRILLQVEDKGQAWYVNPTDGRRYSLGRPDDAFALMRRFALGVSNANFTAIQDNPGAWRNLAGRILLKVADAGKAYYFDPTNFVLYFLGRPQDAFNIMRTRGLGITNSNLAKISIGQ